MAHYKKIYDVKAEYQLPELIFLDKGTSYTFSIFLTARGPSFKSELEPGLWAGPEWSRSGSGGGEVAGTWAPSWGGSSSRP